VRSVTGNIGGLFDEYSVIDLAAPIYVWPPLILNGFSLLTSTSCRDFVMLLISHLLLPTVLRVCSGNL
jgi:hypothetical protein